MEKATVPGATKRRNTKQSSRKSNRRSNAIAGEGSLENVTWRSLADTYRTIHFHIMSDLRHYGLTPPQYSVLRTIGRSEKGFLPMSEIGKRMIVTYANITTIVDNLEKRNMVRRIRNKEDRRIVYVELTAQGSNLFFKIYKSHRKQVDALMQALNKQELETLRAYTTKIKDYITLRSGAPSRK